MSAIIRLEHIHHWYNRGKTNEVHALNDITIEIEQGDYVSFFGPSGCGKTTLLYVTSGIDRISEGHIYIKGKDITAFNNQELAIFRQTGIGIVFQQFNLVPSLSVIENVALPMAFVGTSKEKSLEEARKLLVRFGIDAFANHYPAELSGGQQQRVGIARALANNPPIIIADEPLGNLDSVNAKNVLAMLKELNEKDGRTIIMVTHEAWSLQDVRTVFDMKDGTITQVEHRRLTPDGLVREGGPVNASPAELIQKKLEKEARHNDELHMSARIIANFFMRGHTYEETQRFESLVIDRFSEKIDAAAFAHTLALPYAKGGVDLWKHKAATAAAYVENVIEKRKSLDAIILEMEMNPVAPLADEVKKLRIFVTEEGVMALSPYKCEVLEELIADRVKRNISADQFLRLLYAPVKESGAGIAVHSAQKIAERLETVLEGAEVYAPRI